MTWLLRRRILTLILLAWLSAVLIGTGCRSAAGSAPDGEWPLAPVPQVVRDFDPPSTPFGRGHRGVDLAGHPGQQVRAALPGRVSWAGRLAGVGIVVVDHGATRTTYQPVRDPLPVGADVAAGDPIGVLDLPGSHCFPRACLHWGWLRGEVYLDPLDLVGFRPVRLLPLTGGLAPAYATWRPLAMTPQAMPWSVWLGTGPQAGAAALR